MTDTNVVSVEVRVLISRHIFTVGHLETLRFLVENGQGAFSVEDIAREMRTNNTMASRQLADLNRLLKIDQAEKKSPTYKLNVDDSKQLQTIHELIDLFKSRRHTIIQAIYDPNVDAIRSLADAFKLKKD